MSTTTDNYDLILPAGEDRVNPLTQVNPNFETIDAQMKANANAGIGVANEIKTGTVHALTRITNNGDCAVFRFLATSDYNLGDSFTVDGVSVTALLPSGEALGSGAYVIGSTILCVLVETRLTVYATGGTASDSNALDGYPGSYYLDANNEVFDNTDTNLTSTNTEDAIKEVNGKIKGWTMVELSGTDTTTIPEYATEVFMVLRYGHPTSGMTHISFTHSCVNPRQLPTALWLTNGGKLDTSNTGYYTQITTTTSGTVGALHLFIGTTDYVASSKLYVYYR